MFGRFLEIVGRFLKCFCNYFGMFFRCFWEAFGNFSHVVAGFWQVFDRVLEVWFLKFLPCFCYVFGRRLLDV